MGKEKAPDGQEQTDKLTLRISHELNIYTKKRAKEIGIPQNAFLAVLIDVGLRLHECEFSIRFQKEGK